MALKYICGRVLIPSPNLPNVSVARNYGSGTRYSCLCVWPTISLDADNNEKIIFAITETRRSSLGVFYVFSYFSNEGLDAISWVKVPAGPA